MTTLYAKPLASVPSSLSPVAQVRELGGTIFPTDKEQSWMRYRATLPGLDPAYGTSEDEAARNVLRRRPVQQLSFLEQEEEPQPTRRRSIFKRLFGR